MLCKNHIPLCLFLFVIYFLNALIFHRYCFFNSAFEYDHQLGFGNHFNTVDQLSGSSIIEIYRMIFQGVEGSSNSLILD